MLLFFLGGLRLGAEGGGAVRGSLWFLPNTDNSKSLCILGNFECFCGLLITLTQFQKKWSVKQYASRSCLTG